MADLYISFHISEGIADRGEVSYDTWRQWIAEEYVFGPYDSIVCVYSTIEGYTAETGERETIAHLIDDSAVRYAGYWRVVKRVVTKRFTILDQWRSHRVTAGEPRSYSHPPDELLPPFSDWFIDVEVSAAPRAIREIDAYRPEPGQLGSDNADV